MSKIIILGSSNAIAGRNHENAYMVFVGKTRTVLVDSPHNPIWRLRDVGVDYNDVTDLVLTHFHPDHVSGVPLFMMDMWLRGRKKALDVYGLPHTLDRLENLLTAFAWENWPDFFPVTFNRLPLDELHPFLECDDFKIYSSPVRHMIPTIGMRVEFRKERKVVAYSCDTEPCDEVVRLGKDVDILIHEASGGFVGHSSPNQAAEIATRANAKKLCLIHYPTGEFWQDDTLEKAQENFDGEVVLAEDLMTISF